ncbi:helix-turn-helix domain-containing protein [Paraflavitalea pollutisoli]|uniref:helix-turn-helix domain-containing protein n=1 Tax=Paraflavitalea pollutisoli TaxID=3034143 RepID=UPI0023EAE446|nr:AraC family transcriptional regulator [Paraflavitalea sp. H1-2-19X]
MSMYFTSTSSWNPDSWRDEILYPVQETATRRIAYRPLSLSDEAATNIANQLATLMEEQKPFLQVGYSLKAMSRAIGIPYYLLSFYLNRQAGMRFTDYLNQYRVAYFVDLVAKGELNNLTLSGIAAHCGFQNRNSLAMAVKRFTGMTPSDLARGNKMDH